MGVPETQVRIEEVGEALIFNVSNYKQGGTDIARRSAEHGVVVRP